MIYEPCYPITPKSAAYHAAARRAEELATEGCYREAEVYATVAEAEAETLTRSLAPALASVFTFCRGKKMLRSLAALAATR